MHVVPELELLMVATADPDALIPAATVARWRGSSCPPRPPMPAVRT
jgi:hypothetical protein